MIYARISEKVERAYRSNVLSSTFDVSFDWFERADDEESDNSPLKLTEFPDDLGSVLVPLAFLDRGQLVSSLTVVDRAGKPALVLPSYEVNLIHLSMARTFVAKIDSGASSTYLSEIEPDFRGLLAHSEPPSLDEIGEIVRRVSELLGAEGDPDLVETFLDYIKDALIFNPVCVAVPLAELSALGWPRISTYVVNLRSPNIEFDPSSRGAGFLSRAGDFVRLALGVGTNRFYVRLGNATRARSYHLEVTGPPGTYLAEQGMITTGATDAGSISISAIVEPPVGQRRAKLYVREVQSPPGSVPTFVAKFVERSPGSFYPASIGLLAVSLLLSVLNSLPSGLRTIDSPGVAPLASLLVALPLGAVALFGIDAYRKYRHPGLLSLFFTSLAFLVSVAAIGLLVLGQTSSLTDRFWATLTLVAWAGFFGAASTWLLRTSIESSRRRGPRRSQGA